MSTKREGNWLVIDDKDLCPDTPAEVAVVIWPSSPESGLAVITSGGPVSLSVDDVVALRDWLTEALDQAAGGAPFQVVGSTIVTVEE